MENNDRLKSKLDDYTIKEIILTFSTIDDKIISLHNCSADDFLSFNAYLKKFHQRAKTISKNAQDILIHVTGKKTHVLHCDLDNFHVELNNHLKHFVNQIDSSFEILQKISNEMNLLFVPLKNLKQNFMTQRFLNTSLRLNLDYSSIIDKDDMAQDIDKINKLVYQVKSIVPIIEDNLFQLNQEMKDVLSEIKEIKKINVNNVDSILEQVRSSIKLLTECHSKTADRLPNLTEKTENYFKNIDKIITNIQYHDIIRQKIEHIQKTHQHIIEQLNTLESDEQKNRKIKYLYKIRDIAGLQIAQLIHINKQYQSAIQTITTNFFEISDDMSGISNMSQQFWGYSMKSNEIQFTEIENKLESAVETIRELFKTHHQFTFKIQTLFNGVQRNCKIFENIKNIITQYSALIEKVVGTINKSNSQNEANENRIVQQIEIIKDDIENTGRKLSEHFENSCEYSKKLYASSDNYTRKNNIDEVYITLNSNIQTVLDTIRDNNQLVLKILDQNSYLSAKIASEIKSSIQKVRYYDYFENVIEEIVVELSKIINKLKNSDKNDKQKKRENLKTLEKQYTSESQRNVHSKYIENETDDIDLFENDKTNDKDSDESANGSIELF